MGAVPRPSSAPGSVVSRTARLAGETLSAASLARTVKEYRVPGRSPVTTAAVCSPPTLWIFESPCRMSYDTTSRSSVDGPQDNCAALLPSAFPPRPPGRVGARRSAVPAAGVVARTSALGGPRPPWVPRARTVNT